MRIRTGGLDWLPEDFETSKKQLIKERALWSAIILRALLDLQCGDDEIVQDALRFFEPDPLSDSLFCGYDYCKELLQIDGNDAKIKTIVNDIKSGKYYTDLINYF